jgi:hypothetical protein
MTVHGQLIVADDNPTGSLSQSPGIDHGSRSTSVSTLGPLAYPSRRGVNIEEAKEEFRQLERQLSKKSHGSTSRPSDNELEKGAGEQGGAFDLREYLSSTNDANAAAGIKHKHVGVTWQDLEVRVLGGVDYKVRVIV